MTGLINPKLREIDHCLFCIILVVYLSRGIFRPVYEQFYFFSKSVVGLRHVFSSEIEKPQKKSGVPLS